VSLLPRFYDPEIGQVLLDGHDIRDYTLEPARQIGVSGDAVQRRCATSPMAALPAPRKRSCTRRRRA
jgi:hypothetical protein